MDIFGTCALIAIFVMACISTLVSYRFHMRLIERLADTNEKLLIVLSSKESNPTGTRALLAVSKEPKKNIPNNITPSIGTGTWPSKADNKAGVTLTVGGSPA